MTVITIPTPPSSIANVIIITAATRIPAIITVFTTTLLVDTFLITINIPTTRLAISNDAFASSRREGGHAPNATRKWRHNALAATKVLQKTNSSS